MSGGAILAVLLALAALGVLIWVGSRAEARAGVAREEIRAALASQAQSLSSQVGQLALSVNQQLGQVRQELQNGVAATGRLATEAQREVAQRLESSTATLLELRQQLGEMQQTGRELSDTAQNLRMVLSGAKSRGTLGEVALERLLEDALPRAAYETQYRFSTGNVVDAIVRSGERLLPIDSKFPLDSYRRLIEGGEEARREFSQAVRKHADSIAEKYIVPGERTMDFALMFVPSEGVYYELLMTEDPKWGLLDEYCRGKRVFPVSPNTCYAYLCAIATSLRGMKVEENARQILNSLAGLKKQLELFAEVYERLGTHLRHAQQSYDEADARFERASNALEQMAEGSALPEAAPKALGAAPEP